MNTFTTEPQTIGILGAGRVGTAIARQALKAGFEVKIATAKPAEEISMIVDIVAPGADPVETTEAAAADISSSSLFRCTNTAHLILAS